MTKEQIENRLLEAFEQSKKEEEKGSIYAFLANFIYKAKFSESEKNEILNNSKDKWADVLPKYGFEVYGEQKKEKVRLGGGG